VLDRAHDPGQRTAAAYFLDLTRTDTGKTLPQVYADPLEVAFRFDTWLRRSRPSGQRLDIRMPFQSLPVDRVWGIWISEWANHRLHPGKTTAVWALMRIRAFVAEEHTEPMLSSADSGLLPAD